MLGTPQVAFVRFISYQSLFSLWFWFIQTLFAGQTLHNVINPKVPILLSVQSNVCFESWHCVSKNSRNQTWYIAIESPRP